MRTTGVYKVWQMIYPVGIYYVVSGLVYFALELILGPVGTDYMLRQLVCAAVTIPFTASFYREDQKHSAADEAGNRNGTDSGWLTGTGRLILSAVAGGTAGAALNNVIAMTRLTELSAGFQEANEAFFAGQLICELLGSCLVIPFAEELLYRGVVYRRIRAVSGITPAIVLSALLFGLMHGNLVQLLYAGLLGLLLALLYERTGSLLAPVLGHIAANLLAVIRQETGWLAFCYEVSPGAVVCTAALALAAAGAVALLLWMERIRGDRGREA